MWNQITVIPDEALKQRVLKWYADHPASDGTLLAVLRSIKHDLIGNPDPKLVKQIIAALPYSTHHVAYKITVKTIRDQHRQGKDLHRLLAATKVWAIEVKDWDPKYIIHISFLSGAWEGVRIPQAAQSIPENERAIDRYWCEWDYWNEWKSEDGEIFQEPPSEHGFTRLTRDGRFYGRRLSIEDKEVWSTYRIEFRRRVWD